MTPEDRAPLGKAGCTSSELQAEIDRKGELALQRQIYQYLLLKESEGELVFCYQNPTKRATGRVGTPDFIIGYRGRFIAVECKVAGGKCTEEQASFLEFAKKAGCISRVVSTLSELLDILRGVSW